MNGTPAVSKNGSAFTPATITNCRERQAASDPALHVGAGLESTKGVNFQQLKPP
jgi:hypothetical protein